MTALEEYEQFARDYRHSHMTAGEGVRKADAAIKELQAALAEMTSSREYFKHEAVQQECDAAELEQKLAAVEEKLQYVTFLRNQYRDRLTGKEE